MTNTDYILSLLAYTKICMEPKNKHDLLFKNIDGEILFRYVNKSKFIVNKNIWEKLEESGLTNLEIKMLFQDILKEHFKWPVTMVFPEMFTIRNPLDFLYTSFKSFLKEV
jgi:hypothetical protein